MEKWQRYINIPCTLGRYISLGQRQLETLLNKQQEITDIIALHNKKKILLVKSIASLKYIMFIAVYASKISLVTTLHIIPTTITITIKSANYLQSYHNSLHVADLHTSIFILSPRSSHTRFIVDTILTITGSGIFSKSSTNDIWIQRGWAPLANFIITNTLCTKSSHNNHKIK